MHFYRVLFVTLAVLPAVFGACCNPTCDVRDLTCGQRDCADGTKSTPCCGVNKCNIFCCACCRKADDSAIDEANPSDPTDSAAFHAADVSSSGCVTLGQYLDSMDATSDDTVYVNWFHEHDRDGNGCISIDEQWLEGEDQ